uniref:Retrovirus-related Pol polyprotein from transposon TNT 1-94-like beta-barrel domain-containing protein n=1 Tax=Cannabis sativa TaxID=3483 RepID=A0A803QK32_CANSA
MCVFDHISLKAIQLDQGFKNQVLELATARYEIDKFTCMNDFGLWRIKMKVLISHQGLADAIQATDSKEDEDVKKISQEIDIKGNSAIIFSLGDEFLREVVDEDSALGLWNNLRSIYMKKFLAKLKRDNNQGKSKYKNQGEADIASVYEFAGVIVASNLKSSGYEFAGVLVAPSSELGGDWTLDSWCSFHMTPNKNLFNNYIEKPGGIVLLGDSKACQIQGISSINLMLHDGVTRMIKQVRCSSVPLNFKALQELWTSQVRYLDGVKGYKLWCLELGYKKCIIIRDVIFNEKEAAMVKKTNITSVQKVGSRKPQIEVY